MSTGRSTLSFLDLALMLLSAFAYAHFMSLADPEARKAMTQQTENKSPIPGSYNFKTTEFFGPSNAMLTEFARKEIPEILMNQPNQILIIYVPVMPEAAGGERLRQWEKVAARSAAIADAFERAGQDGKMIILKMPDKLVSNVKKSQDIRIVFVAPESVLLKN